MIESVDVAVVGAGQAGLATSWFLTQAGADHCRPYSLIAGLRARAWRASQNS